MHAKTDRSKIHVIEDLRALRAQIVTLRADGARIAFVPTMGALHDGHLSLIKVAQAHADRVVASIYVNPTQFAPGEDFDTYPRDTDADVAKLASVGVDLVYVPEATTMYQEDHGTSLHVSGVGEGLETDHRPTFFDGVALVVTKLFNRVQPDIAVFGEKDYQQLAVIRRMVRDLDLPIEIIGAPIARDDHGLALSSRNRYFDDASLQVARQLNVIMFDAADALSQGKLAVEVSEQAKDALLEAGFLSIDYVTVTEADGLRPLTGAVSGPARLLIAAHCPAPDGPVRLIDNCAVGQLNP